MLRAGGLKPARGRISPAPELGDSSLGIDGVLTRTVADTAAILDVLAGYELGDATWAPPPSEPFAVSAAADPGKLRIATTTLPPIPDAKVDPQAARAVGDAAELLRSLGHEVEEVDPPWQEDSLGGLFGAVFSSHIALSIAYSGRVAGREPAAEDMEAMSWAIYSMVQKLGAVESLAADAMLQQFARRLITFLAPYDALLTPALAERPLPLGTLDTDVPEPDGDVLAFGAVYAVHAGIQRERAAGDLAAALPGGGRSTARGADRREAGGGGAAAGAGDAAGRGASLGRAAPGAGAGTHRVVTPTCQAVGA